MALLTKRVVPLPPQPCQEIEFCDDDIPMILSTLSGTTNQFSVATSHGLSEILADPNEEETDENRAPTPRSQKETVGKCKKEETSQSPSPAAEPSALSDIEEEEGRSTNRDAKSTSTDDSSSTDQPAQVKINYTANMRLATSLSGRRSDLGECSSALANSLSPLGTRRSKRLVALKNLRSTFRKVVEQSTNDTPRESNGVQISSEDVKPEAQAEDTSRRSPPTPRESEARTSEPVVHITQAPILSTENSDTHLAGYQDLVKQLESAKLLADRQREHILELRKSNSGSARRSDGAKATPSLEEEISSLRQQLTQLQVNRAWEDYQWRQRHSQELRRYKQELSRYEEETRNWQKKFEDAWEDQESKVKAWREKAERSQRELAAVKKELMDIKEKGQSIGQNGQDENLRTGQTLFENDILSEMDRHSLQENCLEESTEGKIMRKYGRPAPNGGPSPSPNAAATALHENTGCVNEQSDKKSSKLTPLGRLWAK